MTKRHTCSICETVIKFPDDVTEREMECACRSDDISAFHVDLGDVTRPSVPYVNSPNRSAGLAPVGIVIHYTAGSYAGAISWFQNPSSQVSAQFVVAKDGRRTQMVPLPNPDITAPRDGRYKAWHCRTGNSRYFGIEHEGNGRPEEWTDAMLRSSAELAAYLCSLYRIPITGPPGPAGHRVWFTGFGGHDNVPGNNHTDPGPHFPWQRYLELVGESLEEFEEPSWPDFLTREVARIGDS